MGIFPNFSRAFHGSRLLALCAFSGGMAYSYSESKHCSFPGNYFNFDPEWSFRFLPSGYLPSQRKEANQFPNDIPRRVDWREKGAVTSVKDQDMWKCRGRPTCGNCWAVAAVGAVEGVVKIATGELDNLSIQQVMDCDKEYGNRGCKGGFVDRAFAYMIINGGLLTEKDYPSRIREYRCNKRLLRKGKSRMVTIDSYGYVPKGEAGLLRAIARQPVVVILDASCSAFDDYNGGIYKTNCGFKLGHAMLAVGYSIEDDKPYVILKNSYGATWGEDGYMRIAIGYGGICGLYEQACYPIKQRV